MNKAERYAQYKAEGKCPNCLNPAEKYVYCNSCLERATQKLKEKAKSAEKFCIDCNVPLPYTGKYRGKRCRDCATIADKESSNNWYRNLDPERKAKRRERSTEYARNWRIKNPDRYMDRVLRREFGITFSDFKETYDKQNGKCAICLEKLPDDFMRSKSRKGVHIDHDHVTDVVRGILCFRCNIGLGSFRDSPEFLRSAALYLEK